MKRFEFRLARLARVRAAEEQTARQVWQNAEIRFRAAERRVKRILGDIAAATEDLRRAQADPSLDPREVLAIETSMRHLAAILESARRQLETLRAVAEEAREPWQELRAEVAGLARLEEKDRAAHRREMEREETKQMDQIASERAARSPGSSSSGGSFQANPESRRLDAKAK